jgi:hypothetical protein
MASNANNNVDLESQDNTTRKDSETYQSTVIPASAIDFDPEPHKRLFRTFANPAPLGLCGFALTTFVLSLVNVHATSVTTPNIVIGLGMLPGLFCVLIGSSCLWRPCTILCRHVGIRERQHFRCGRLLFIRCFLDELCVYIHPVVRRCGCLHQRERAF